MLNNNKDFIYNPSAIEKNIYTYWIKNNFFSSKPNKKEAYSIVIPPPNITGILHMGHVLNNTIQDILARKARMENKNVCWIPGTDHASIATENKVWSKLLESGKKKEEISRDEFLEEAWKWKKKHADFILNQLKNLGCSLDWNRTKFTLDTEMSESVTKTFIKLFKDGYIYKGKRIINWDSKIKTALSDEEVIYKKQKSILYTIKYRTNSTKKPFILISTTRPETIFGDSAICINPNDSRYKKLDNIKIFVPIINREIKLIKDSYVDIDFGTGCLKVTPCHDVNDYELGLKHNLDFINIMNKNGTLNEVTGEFNNIDRFKARKLIVKKLKEEGLLIKEEQIENNIGFSERSGVIIEPRVSSQWFLKMEKLAKPALENVLNDNIKFHPKKYKVMYQRWMENIKDWCISRQLWWGHRIPVYYLPSGSFFVAENKEIAYKIAKEKYPNEIKKPEDLKQDKDVLDTWFSSWLWPISVFDGVNKPENKDIKYYYPTSVLVTAPDIIFFWVARMIIFGYYNRNSLTFKDVYFTGIVRDLKRRKMSKSLGNSPDPINLINKHGADAVRIGMMLSTSAGNDLLYDEKLIIQGRNFCNKLWNVLRLVNMFSINPKIKETEEDKKIVLWFQNVLNKKIEEINRDFKSFKLSDALMKIYKLIWDDFCSIYIELIKTHNKEISSFIHTKTNEFINCLLKLSHPFMPFITEKIWQNNVNNKTIQFEKYPKSKEVNNDIIKSFSFYYEIVKGIRAFRNSNNIKKSISLNVQIKLNEKLKYNFISIITKLENINFINNKKIKGYEFEVGVNKVIIEQNLIDLDLEKIKKETIRLEKFAQTITKKLSNENFIANAPEKVILNEKKKLEDCLIKIKNLKKTSL